MTIAFGLKRPAILAGALLTLAAPATAEVTFYRDVLPILQKSCQECHRPGEVGPMPLMTYEQTKKAASRIGEALTLGKMPPWFADPAVNHFANDRTLPRGEVETIQRWIESGTAAGDPKDAPPPSVFTEGWQIGQPDLVLELPNAYQVPAHGLVEYQFVVLPLNFTEDRWVQAFEVRPGNPAVVHHITAVMRGPGSRWLAEVPPGTFRPKRGDTVDPTGLGMSAGSLGAYTPGQPPVTYKPGRAMLVKAGSDLVLEMHYTPNGKPAADRSRVGFIFARQRPAEMVRRFTVVNTRFEIPPGMASVRVDASTTIKTDMKLVALHPHMHLRGKAAEVSAALPNGETRTLLKARYDPMWQLRYVLADELELKYGTRLDASWWFDNSRHRYNPDPTATVRWGDQNWEEMALMGFEVVVPLGSQTRGGLVKR